jgi:hypothetical protein
MSSVPLEQGYVGICLMEANANADGVWVGEKPGYDKRQMFVMGGPPSLWTR